MDNIMNEFSIQYKEARKSKDTEKSKVLGYLIGEFSMIGKNDGNRETTHEEALEITKAFVKSSKKAIRDIGDSNAEAKLTFENDLDIIEPILENFIPKEMSEQELKDLILSFNTKNIGLIMKSLKSSGLAYDGSTASKIARSL